MKKLISTLALTSRHYLSMRMMGISKPSKGKAAEAEISVSVISVDESKEKEKTLVLSSALVELLLIVRRINKFQVT